MILAWLKRLFRSKPPRKLRPVRHDWGKAQYNYWFARWDDVMRRCWGILSNGEPTLERFHRFERNHKRLLRLLQAKGNEFFTKGAK